MTDIMIVLDDSVSNRENNDSLRDVGEEPLLV